MSRDVSQRPDLLAARSGMSTNVHGRPPTFEFASDSWLDPDSFQGQVTIQFREAGGEGFGLRLGDE